MKRNESIEDYLEKILMLSKELSFVRSIDIAKSFGYTKASISIAMKKLSSNNLININEQGHILLTDEGKRIANEVYDRHQTVAGLLIKLGVDEDIALEDACKIEHDISEETFSKIKEFLNKGEKIWQKKKWRNTKPLG